MTAGDLMSRSLLAVVAVLAFAGPTSAQQLGEGLPTVERVVNDLRVPGAARQTAARTGAGLYTLSFLAGVSGEQVKAQEYFGAANALMRAEDAKYDQTCRGAACDKHRLIMCRNVYELSDAFRREIVDRYFSPAWQEHRFAQLKGRWDTPWKNILALPAGTRRFDPKTQLADGAFWCGDEPPPVATAASAPTAPAAEAEPTAKPAKQS